MTGIKPYGLKAKPISDDELISMQAGQRLKGLLPEFEQVISDQQRRITTQAISLVAKGELTPERAQSLWFEYAAFTNALRGIENKARIGDAAGKKLAALANGD